MKKETFNDRSQERPSQLGLQVRLRQRRRLPLQSLHLQELRLLSGHAHPRLASGGACPCHAIRVKISPLLVCAAFVWAAVAAPGFAQGMDMPGMTMPKPASPVPAPTPQPQPPQVHAADVHAAMSMPSGGSSHEALMKGALGPYSMERESSGTAWQPDSSEHDGLMTMSGNWMLMAHGVVNFVGDHQSGRRGDDKIFASGMLMGMARRPFGDGTLQLRAMISPDPLMGPNGYPLLLASGETATAATA